jgi:hypothetical protein
MSFIRSFAAVAVAASFVGVVGCGKNSSSPLQSSADGGSQALARVTSAYGTPQVVTLYAGQTIPAGTVTVMNDGQELTVVFETNNGWNLAETHVHIASRFADIPQTKTGNPKIGNFALKHTLSPVTQQDEHTINLANYSYVVGTELYIAAHAVVRKIDASGAIVQSETGWGDGLGFPGGSWAEYFTYVVQDQSLRPSPGIQPGDFRTQTQGGWGSVARGGNPGSYRDVNFAGAFPNGLIVGNVRTATFTSSSAAEAALPTGGTPGALGTSYVDPDPNDEISPSATEAGVLLGQVVALTLSVNFDLADPNFGASNVNLKDLKVISGPFAGKTVAQVLAEANKVLGGSASTYTAAQVNEAVSAINENFVDGTQVGDYLAQP